MGNVLGQQASQETGSDARNQAHRVFEQRNILFKQSQEAYRAGDGAKAKQLSTKAALTEGVTKNMKAKLLDAQAKRINQRAAEEIYDANNKHRSDDFVDLHGLYVAEAIKLAETKLMQGKASGIKSLVFIVGRGLHSSDGVAKLRPAVEALIHKHNLRCVANSPHQGCLLVEFVSKEDKGWVFGPSWCIVS